MSLCTLGSAIPISPLFLVHATVALFGSIKEVIGIPSQIQKLHHRRFRSHYFSTQTGGEAARFRYLCGMTKHVPNKSFASMTELVFPNDTNTLGNLMGGRLLHWMDIVTAISAARHCNRVVVTASVDFVDFKSPISLGEVVLLEAKVTRAFTTSMEVRVEVWAENMQSGERRYCNSAYYTFVAVDQTGRPIPVAKVGPETEAEKELYEGALRRRELRLVSAGRIKPEEATHLKKIFLT